MSRVFKTGFFMRKTKKMDISDVQLANAVQEMEKGLVDANLGSNVYKKRLSYSGRGKSGGARTIVAAKEGSHWFFLYAFAKNDRDNITANELSTFREAASAYLSLSDQEIETLINLDKLMEVNMK